MYVFSRFWSYIFNSPKIVNKSLPEKYIFENGGREHLLNINGLSKKDLLNTAKKLI